MAGAGNWCPPPEFQPRIGPRRNRAEERDTFTRLPWLPDEGHHEGVRVDNKTKPTFATLRVAVEMISAGLGESTRGAAASLADMLNDAVGEGRPALFEMAGPVRKVVADPDDRYDAVILALNCLMPEPPAHGWSCVDEEARYLMGMRHGRVLLTQRQQYERDVAVLDRVQVRVAEFEEFAGIAPQVPSASTPVAAHPESVTPTAEAVPVQGAGISKHVIQVRRNPLAAVFDRAKQEATDSTCPYSVWAALVAMATGQAAPPELTDYRGDKGIQATGARGGWLSKAAFMDRWRRGTV